MCFIKLLLLLEWWYKFEESIGEVVGVIVREVVEKFWLYKSLEKTEDIVDDAEGGVKGELKVENGGGIGKWANCVEIGVADVSDEVWNPNMMSIIWIECCDISNSSILFIDDDDGNWFVKDENFPKKVWS